MNWKIEVQKYVDVGIVKMPSIYEGKEISLLSLSELQEMKKNFPDTLLVSIWGIECFARDANEDTRGGWTAYGRITK